ncbi:hypothetical protein B566_EDAN006823 [Ephemera danica]|nr:hypothetical protein B566_EDAN006823 [Ephemera danica]
MLKKKGKYTTLIKVKRSTGLERRTTMNVFKYTLDIDDDDSSEVTYDKTSTTVCGWFTKDTEGQYCEDKKYVKYLCMPQSNRVRFDLNKTHSNDVYKSQEKMSETIDSMLHWISLHSMDPSGKPQLPDTEFVCYRGLLSRIMWTPYEKSDSLKLCAVRLNNIIYLYAPNATPDTDQPLSEFEETCCMFTSQIGSHKIMYGAELDGFPNEEAFTDLSTAKFVELKTCKENPSEYSFKRFKLLKWWSQSWLVDIDKVVVGYRDDKGFRFWNDKTCKKFLVDFLSFVKFAMRDAPNDDPNAVYNFEWDPNNADTIDFTGTRLPSDHQCKFIPEWYLEWLNKV